MDKTIGDILKNPDLNDTEKKDMVDKVMGKGNTQGKLGEALQTSGINAVVKETDEQRQHRKDVTAKAKEAQRKKDEGRTLWKDEKEALEEATKNGWLK